MTKTVGEVFWDSDAERFKIFERASKEYFIESYFKICPIDIIRDDIDIKYYDPELEEDEYERLKENLAFVDAKYPGGSDVVYRILTESLREEVNTTIEEFRERNGPYLDYEALKKDDSGYDYDGFTDDELILLNENIEGMYVSVTDEEIKEILLNLHGPIRNMMYRDLLENRLAEKLDVQRGKDFDKLSESEQYAIRVKSARINYLDFRNEHRVEVRQTVEQLIGLIWYPAIDAGEVDRYYNRVRYGLGFRDYKYYRSILSREFNPSLTLDYASKEYELNEFTDILMNEVNDEDRVELQNKIKDVNSKFLKFIKANDAVSKRIKYVSLKTDYLHKLQANETNLDLYATCVARKYNLMKNCFCSGYDAYTPLNAIASLFYIEDVGKAFYCHLFEEENHCLSSTDDFFNSYYIDKFVAGYDQPDLFIDQYGEKEKAKNKNKDVIRRLRRKGVSIDKFKNLYYYCSWVYENKPYWMTDALWEEYLKERSIEYSDEYLVFKLRLRFHEFWSTRSGFYGTLRYLAKKYNLDYSVLDTYFFYREVQDIP